MHQTVDRVSPRPDVVLLDRDGTINVKAREGNYITSPEQVQLLPGAGEAIRALNEAGVPVVVVTNQRGIALGRMTERTVNLVHERLADLLLEHGATMDEVFHCPHEKALCMCRKPGTLMLRRAQWRLGLATLRGSAMIGDSTSDVEAGQRVGARTILLSRGVGTSAPAGVEVAGSLLEAVIRILR